MKGKVSGVGIMILLFLLMVEFPSAHAYTIPNTTRVSVSSTTTAGLTLTVLNIGDLLVLEGQVQDGSSAGKTSVSIVSVTGGETWTLAVAKQLSFAPNCSAGNCFDDEIWYASAGASGSDSISVTFSQNMGTAGAQIQIEDVAGVYPLALGTSTSSCASACGTSFSTTGSVSITAGDLAVGSIWTSCEAGSTLTQGANYIRYGPTSLFEGSAEYGDPASPPTISTNFPFTCSVAQSTIIDVGAVFGAGALVTNILVVPCTYTQIQCWWFPMLFYGVFASSFLMIGKAGGVDGRGMVFLLLAALAFCSLIQVQMNMTNIMLPVILSITGIVYAVRAR